MRTSEQINEIATALALAQKEVKNAVANTKNPFFKSSYADLESVKAACVPALNEQGISVIQAPENAEGGIVVQTRLLHKSGQWIESDLRIPIAKHDAQTMGSAVSYARRYALAAMCGVATADDDGNSATNKTAAPAAAPTPPAPRNVVKIDPAPDNPEELGMVAMNFGVKYLNQHLKDIPIAALEKASKVDLEDPAQLYVQDCITKLLKIGKESVS
jgi:hypothetical protein